MYIRYVHAKQRFANRDPEKKGVPACPKNSQTGCWRAPKGFRRDLPEAVQSMSGAPWELHASVDRPCARRMPQVFKGGSPRPPQTCGESWFKLASRSSCGTLGCQDAGPVVAKQPVFSPPSPLGGVNRPQRCPSVKHSFSFPSSFPRCSFAVTSVPLFSGIQ